MAEQLLETFHTYASNAVMTKVLQDGTSSESGMLKKVTNAVCCGG